MHNKVTIKYNIIFIHQLTYNRVTINIILYLFTN